MNQDELNEVLDKHQRWLNNLSGGKCADLRNSNLRYADFRYEDLGYADLRHADLWGADLRGADLQNANLQDTDLRNADLGYADLRHADLQDTNLLETNLSNIYLLGAKLENSGIHTFDNYYFNSTGLYKSNEYGWLHREVISDSITKLFEDIAKDLSESSDK